MRILHLIPFLWSGAGDVVSRLAISQHQNATVGVVTSGSSKGESDWDSYRTRLRDARVSHFQVDLFDRDPNVFWDSVVRLGEVFEEFSPISCTVTPGSQLRQPLRFATAGIQTSP